MRESSELSYQDVMWHVRAYERSIPSGAPRPYTCVIGQLYIRSPEERLAGEVFMTGFNAKIANAALDAISQIQPLVLRRYIVLTGVYNMSDERLIFKRMSRIEKRIVKSSEVGERMLRRAQNDITARAAKYA